MRVEVSSRYSLTRFMKRYLAKGTGTPHIGMNFLLLSLLVDLRYRLKQDEK